MDFESEWGEEYSLHQERLDTVAWYVRASGARSVLDLGCGPGELLARLVGDPQFERLLGIDLSMPALLEARHLLGEKRVQLMQASFTEPDDRLMGFDAATLVETIEHVPPRDLSAVESAVFACYRPGTVLLTTPNREYNEILGVPSYRFRHPDHRFEWNREKFRKWASGVARRHAYRAEFVDIGECHPVSGSSTQMAVFRRLEN